MTVISATNPYRYENSCLVFLKVWFEELSGPVNFVASPLDSERHGKELWIRALAGEFGPVTVLELSQIQPPECEMKVIGQ